jgi:hypothetical protein
MIFKGFSIKIRQADFYIFFDRILIFYKVKNLVYSVNPIKKHKFRLVEITNSIAIIFIKKTFKNYIFIPA